MIKKLESVVFKCSPINMQELGSLFFEFVGDEAELTLLDAMIENHFFWSESKSGYRKLYANTLISDSPYDALLKFDEVIGYKINLSAPLIWLGRIF